MEVSMIDLSDLMSEESQRTHIIDQFRILFDNTVLPVTVEWTPAEEIVVSWNPLIFYIMDIGSDDDRYRFELWLDGRDTGIYIEFAFPGEML